MMCRDYMVTIPPTAPCYICLLRGWFINIINIEIISDHCCRHLLNTELSYRRQQTCNDNAALLMPDTNIKSGRLFYKIDTNF